MTIVGLVIGVAIVWAVAVRRIDPRTAIDTGSTDPEYIRSVIRKYGSNRPCGCDR